ncbi:DUF4397 domain-containing protein [Salinibacterium sp. NK8237]|uniref:DUF4397 domain-containing protein n=1 Tax=Salinibacterium sp. NK8237 TaxID=2792038 RepID=UPI0018CDFEC8|nr:DUF4397 domain-containing protein [Salinibacterium sp. NK8237]MBH0131542.1 DUF4397 domain-containing protein [Salinibacterium sp. NK8237]
MRNKIFAGVAAGAIAAVGVAIPANAISDTTADLYVLHAVPGLTVDVYVNGELTLDDFEPGDLAGPLDLPADTYTVAITTSDAADDSSPAIGPIDLTLEGNMSYTAVAHLDESGDPTASLFTNDLSTIAAGEGRLTVRHTAAAPSVDVLADGAAAFENLSNPDEVKADLGVGTISAAVALTGTTDPVIGPADVEIAEGINTIVYAWGSAEDDNLDIAVQTIDGLHSNPDGVDAGTAGLVADNNNGILFASLGGLLALLALAGFAATRLTAARAAK